MRTKGAKGSGPLAPKARWVPNHNWDDLSHSWPQVPSNPKWPKRPSGPPWTTFQPMASGSHQRPPDQLRNLSPQLKGDFYHSSMDPVLKVAGVVHIWYYIPLCTIFSQKCNGEVFRTKFHDPKPRSQHPIPILKEDSSANQSGNPWRLAEDYSRTPTTWPCRSWVGNYFRIIPRAILRGYSSLNQLSRQ
ncbi:hypothetical protein O181_074139 [Austropuccinia psidii MF-1]|uniref:Uncharacterized protein n=1 Tax=Austropuccinia psidii MF-1 TaxID=1389203 RepID=A0A9Q3F8I2_9BASI|nr:hypothetical protein [Austropuccinia psidii MF-1]